MEITRIENITIVEFGIEKGIEIHNSILHAENLSFEAKGLIVHLLYRQNKGLSMKDFLNSCIENRYYIKKILKELKEKNYVYEDNSKREIRYFLKKWVTSLARFVGE